MRRIAAAKMNKSNHETISSKAILPPLLLTFFTILTLTLLTPSLTLTVQAEEGNGAGSGDNAILTDHTSEENYPSYSKTGWLVYLSDSDGNLCSEVAFVSSNSRLPIGYSPKYLTTRIGNAHISKGLVFTNAEWGPPMIEGDGRGGIIKNEIITGTNYSTNGDNDNNACFIVKKYLGDAALDLFKNEPTTHYLILETCAWHKLFSGDYQGSSVVVSASGVVQMEIDSNMSPTSDGHAGWMDNGRLQVAAYLDKDWPGLPQSIDPSIPPAVNATTRLSTDIITTYGMGLIAIRGIEVDTLPNQTHTWDSITYPTIEGKPPLPPTPPTSPTSPTSPTTPLTPATTPNPTDPNYQYTIIKSYRLRDAAGNLTDKGTFTREQTVSTIRIEDEPLNSTDKNYKVIGWKSSTAKDINISSLGWETSVPQFIGSEGTTPTITTLDPQHKILYVLLEANISTPTQPGYNYI